VVDNFGIKVPNMHDMDHLVDALKERYTVAVNMTGSLFAAYNSPGTTCKDTLIATYPATPTCSLQGGANPIWRTSSEGGA
jgi:hypothetical protein